VDWQVCSESVTLWNPRTACSAGTGIVEVDGQLHQPEAKKAGIEIEVLLGVARDGGDVMNTWNWLGH
jgi:hypothetical protein